MSDDLVARLRDRIHDSHMDTERLIDDAADTIEALEAELAECRKDAERYRWLRDTPDTAGGHGWAIPDWYECFDMEVGLDAAIDNAMEGAKHHD